MRSLLFSFSSTSTNSSPTLFIHPSSNSPDPPEPETFPLPLACCVAVWDRDGDVVDGRVVSLLGFFAVDFAVVDVAEVGDAVDDSGEEEVAQRMKTRADGN